MSLATIAQSAGEAVQKNAPAILTALGVSGVATSAFLSAKAGYTAGLRIRDEEDGRREVLSGKDKFELVWKLFIPAVLVGGASVAAVITLNTVHSRRHAAALTALALGETAFREYRDEIVAVAGKQKDKKAIDELATRKAEAAEGSEIIFVGDDKVLTFDTLSGRFFQSSQLEVERLEIEFNRHILNDDYASQNEWYDLLGLGRIATGDDVGWNNQTPLEIQFTAMMRENKPVMCLSYRFHPIHRFNRFG